jgi:dTDP-4-amino-4,6-dideoxygalactose transaminase
MSQALASGKLSGDGPFTKRCEKLLEADFRLSRVLLTTSCTHALEMAALLCDLKDGDEVILPTYTFVSTANAFALRHATLVFLDIRPDTLNLDERLLEDAITPRTRVVVPVHYAGVACEMAPILETSNRHGVAVIEDNAHGIYAKYRGKWLGTIGTFGTLSFHDTKNFTCGEGGALLVNDLRFAERAEVLREKGTDRSRFVRGEVEKYTWVGLGSSYVASDLLAAFLLAQLEVKDLIIASRRRVFEYYQTHLREWAARNGVRLPFVPPYCEQSYHMFYLIMPSADLRAALLAHLAQCGIVGASHYVPLHKSVMARQWQSRLSPCPVAESVSESIVRLPFFNDMTEDQQEYVVETVCKFEC